MSLSQRLQILSVGGFVYRVVVDKDIEMCVQVEVPRVQIALVEFSDSRPEVSVNGYR